MGRPFWGAMKVLSRCLVLLLGSVFWTSARAEVARLVETSGALPSKIAFGSCSKQTKPQPVLRTVVANEPDLFLYLGDNIYGDTRDMDVLRGKYDQLGSKPEFQALRASTSILSVWDDHDYGENDAGKEYPMKEESREIFFDFWRVPEDSPRRAGDGIYGVHEYRDGDRTLQVILLDTRTFRDSLQRNPRPLPEGSPWKHDYQPIDDPERTILGATQWAWLESVLRRPASVRIVATSIQFGHEYNGWESWNNLPAEQRKMIELIRSTEAGGVVFISGDVHWGEISKREPEGGYPLYDITASGLTETWPEIDPNRYRVGSAVPENHFGMIEIDWESPDPQLAFRLINRAGQVRNQVVTPVSRLSFED